MGEQSTNDLGLHSALYTMILFSGPLHDYFINSHNSSICNLPAHTCWAYTMSLPGVLAGIRGVKINKIPCLIHPPYHSKKKKKNPPNTTTWLVFKTFQQFPLCSWEKSRPFTRALRLFVIWIWHISSVSAAVQHQCPPCGPARIVVPWMCQTPSWKLHSLLLFPLATAGEYKLKTEFPHIGINLPKDFLISFQWGWVGRQSYLLMMMSLTTERSPVVL